MSIFNLFQGSTSSLTSFFSVEFLTMFLPLAILLFAVFPKKCKKYILIIESCTFFTLISGALVTYLLLSAASIFGFGLWLDKLKERKKQMLAAAPKENKKSVKKEFQSKSRIVLALCLIIHFGGLLIIKYSAFAAVNINSLLSMAGFQAQLGIPKLVMPIGISFFTLQAASYIIDVYRGKLKADKNFLRILLWISFFPQIIEGPICRYSQTADQLWNTDRLTFSNLSFGLQRILYGLIKKTVIADRLNPLIENIYSDYENFHGGVMILGAVCYTIQLYMEFSGSMDAVMGTAQILGINMPENFRQPFFSKTIPEFWKRWHISLGEWLKDYIFYPITMSKQIQKLTKTARKKFGNYFGALISSSVALFFVWLVNGLWHGAAWNYIFFGMYHFVLILTGKILFPVSRKINQKLHINTNSKLYISMQIVRSTCLVIIGEMFFRANGLSAGLAMFSKIVTDFSFADFNKDFFVKLGIDAYDFLIVFITLIIVFVISVFNEKNISIRSRIKAKPVVFRWALIYAGLMYLIIFGAYGIGYTPVDPIYANF